MEKASQMNTHSLSDPHLEENLIPDFEPAA